MRQPRGRFGLAGLLAVIVAPPAVGDAQVIGAAPVGDCTLSVEARAPEPQVLRVRASHPSHRECQIDEASLSALLRTALPAAQGLPPAPAYSSLFIGRLVDFPWLSGHVARSAATDPDWNGRTGRPVREDVNRYVARLLVQPGAIRTLRLTLEGAGYRIVGASVEKVLVLPAREIRAVAGEPFRGRLPFDALTWFRLAPR